MKGYLVSIVIVAASLVSLGISVNSCRNQKQRGDRLEDNQVALLEDVTYYKTSDSLNAVSVQVLTLTKSEYEKHFSDLEAENKRLKLDNKRLESAMRTATKSEYSNLEMQWQERMDGKIDTMRCVDYADGYLTFKGCDEEIVLKADIFIVDTLVQFVHRVPKQWRFFKWGTKAVRQEVLSKNRRSVDAGFCVA
ncbi:MAG: hypothetical protein FWH36_04880 [Lentimicrobiaceae bacterium]|nr:hypothetical protein [Lentimicrobiaceae bacterium]